MIKYIKQVVCWGFFLLVFNSALAKGAVQVFKFATEATYPPFEVVSSSGKIQGFDVDVANAICGQLKVKCEFINQPFDSLIPNLNIGKFTAIIAAMNITKDRAKSVDFSIPYYKSSGSFVANKGDGVEPTVAGLKNKIIGVQQGTTFYQYLRHVYGNSVKIQTYPSIQNAFIDMGSGRVDLVFGDTPIMQQWINQHGNGKFNIVGKSIYDSQYFGMGYGIAVKKGNTKNLEQINRAINKLEKDGTLKKIVAKYFG